MFIADGMAAVAWEFRQPELSRDFVVRLWDMLLRDDDVSTVLMRFIWDLPLGKKRIFIKAVRCSLVRPLPNGQGPLERLARGQHHCAVCP